MMEPIDIVTFWRVFFSADGNGPKSFEQYCKYLLQDNGFVVLNKEEHIGKDGGIDIAYQTANDSSKISIACCTVSSNWSYIKQKLLDKNGEVEKNIQKYSGELNNLIFIATNANLGGDKHIRIQKSIQSLKRKYNGINVQFISSPSELLKVFPLQILSKEYIETLNRLKLDEARIQFLDFENSEVNFDYDEPGNEDKGLDSIEMAEIFEKLSGYQEYGVNHLKRGFYSIWNLKEAEDFNSLLLEGHNNEWYTIPAKINLGASLTNLQVYNYLIAIQWMQDDEPFASGYFCLRLLIEITKKSLDTWSELSQESLDLMHSCINSIPLSMEYIYLCFYYLHNYSRSIPLRIFSLLEQRKVEYLDITSSKLIVELNLYLFDPVFGLASLKSEENLYEWAQKTSKIIKSKTELLLYMITVSKLMSIIKIEKQNFYIELLEAIKRTLPKELTSSTHFTSSYLSELLHTFYRNREVKYLISYETHYLKVSHTLKKRDIECLQLEYASCIYFLTFNSRWEEDDVQKLEIVKRLKEGNAQALKIFHSIEGEGLSKIKSGATKDVRIWLEEFFRIRVFKSVLITYESSIVINSLLRCTIKFYFTNEPKNQFLSQLLNKLEIQESYIGDNKKSHYAYGSEIVSRFSYKGEHKERYCKYAKMSMLSDEYSIIRNSRYISILLHRMYFYGDEKAKSLAIEYGNSLLSVLTKNLPDQYNYARGVLAIMGLGKSVNDEKFVIEYNQLLKGSNFRKGILRDKQKILFGTESRTILRKFAENGSVVARLLEEEIQDPECWNLIGTWLHDKKDFSIVAVDTASAFYSFAGVIAKSQGERSDKYLLNYIRSHTEYIDYCIDNDSDYDGDVDFFIMAITRANKGFRYYNECIERLPRAIKYLWGDMEESQKQRISSFLLIGSKLKDQLYKKETKFYVNILMPYLTGGGRRSRNNS